jgi:hypothetical protein
MATVAAVRARLREFVRQRGKSYRQLADYLNAARCAKWSHVKLRRFEGDGQTLSPAELEQLDRAFDDPHAARKHDRRLRHPEHLDAARAIVDACDPWIAYAAAAAQYADARDWMTAAEDARAWRTVERRYREWGTRDVDGRQTDRDARLTLNEASTASTPRTLLPARTPSACQRG